MTTPNDSTQLETTSYLCIGCPLGCRLEVDEDVGTHVLVAVRGFSCKRGKEYAQQEHVAPQRTVTTTVTIDHALRARLPVKSSKPIPKALIQTVCQAMRPVRVQAPIHLGDVIAHNILETGADIVATCDMPAAPN
jgi:CxxC motif-containing protein